MPTESEPRSSALPAARTSGTSLKVKASPDKHPPLREFDQHGLQTGRTGHHRLVCRWVLLGTPVSLFQESGVRTAESGYSGGTTENPTYQEVLTGKTGYYETVRVTYDPLKITYEELTEYFWRFMIPVKSTDRGRYRIEYESAIFYRSRDQFDTALKLIRRLETGGMKVATRVLPQKMFYRAESYHQDYYRKKGTLPYCHYWTKRF